MHPLILILASFIGTWHGSLKVGMTELPLQINIEQEEQETKATVDSPAQGAYGIPAEYSSSADTLSISIPAIGASYSGILSGSTITGTFRQSGMQFPLTLTPGVVEIARPQTPTPPYPYNTEEVTFVNPADSAILSGTLTIPTAQMLRGVAATPCVVMVSGSGLQDRDETILGHKPFAVIAHQLALAGIASLRYDDRGFGKSTGSVDNATTATFASDAEAAANFLRGRRYKAVGVMGHSEGADIAFMLGARGKANFVVAIGAPAIPGDSLLLMQNRDLMTLSGIDSATVERYVDALGNLFQYMKQKPGATRCEAIENLDLPEGMKENLAKVIGGRNAWLDYNISRNPAPDISGTAVPVMAVGGELDRQVDAAANLGRIKALLPKATVKQYPGLNHLMQHASSGLPSEYGQIEETFSPEVIADITRWILHITKK